jgi:hypothetical protein
MNACTRTESIGAFDRYENDFACRSSNTRIAPSQSPISRRQSSRTQRDRGKLRRAVVGEDRGRKEGKEPSTRWRGRPRFCGGSCSPGCARKVSDRRWYTSLHVAATGRWAEEVRRWCGGGVAVVWRWCGGGVAEVVAVVWRRLWKVEGRSNGQLPDTRASTPACAYRVLAFTAAEHCENINERINTAGLYCNMEVKQTARTCWLAIL